MIRADPLSITPLIGAAFDYSSNPYLIVGGHSVSDEALLLNAPTQYDLDSTHFALVPSVRYSDSGSYASLNSNYLHVSASGQYLTDVDSFTLTGSYGIDSSLYQNGLTSGGVGVRSDSSTIGLDWQRSITERSQVELDTSWSKDLYGQSALSAGLVNYRYLSVDGVFNYQVTERDKLKLLAGGGGYQALDGLTKSRNDDLQLGFERRLTEICTFSATVGYAKSDNTESVYYGPYLLETIRSEQKGPVYSATLVRQGQLTTLTASVSRAYRPSGFDYLSRQDLVSLVLGYIRSERWSFGAEGDFARTATPDVMGVTTEERYYSGKLSARWNWMSQWVVALQATWVKLTYESSTSPSANPQSTGVTLQITRQFLRTDL